MASVVRDQSASQGGVVFSTLCFHKTHLLDEMSHYVLGPIMVRSWRFARCPAVVIGCT